MAAAPGKMRASGIPTPGKSSGIPTPGRLRSASSVNSQPVFNSDDYASRAFAEAIKANDPAQHRASLAHNPSSSSSSPKSALSALHSGRRSVAGRPSSVTSAPPTRAKTPSARPQSRQSDAFPRSVSRTGRTFDVGDNVRIESLGYEGVLRYLGEIDGKPGLWAGVELGGGFSGKGKNDGSVSGKQYFACPPNCGVFVAASKLSPPTVGPNYRPPSVTSSRGHVTPCLSGRVTPSAPFSISAGRMTPSTSFGRVTPHDSRTNPLGIPGRVTPGSTPATRKSKPVYGLGKTHSPVSPALETQITSGSRASKYIGLTAKQLNSRAGPNQTEYSLKALPSPSRSSSNADAGARLLDSPFTTPKAAATKASHSLNGSLMPGSKSRASFNTSRPRIPSAVAMPPPASPARSASFGSTYSLNDDLNQGDHVQEDRPPSSLDLTAASRALQDKINRLIGGSTVSDSPDVRPSSSPSQIHFTPSADTTQDFESKISSLNDHIKSLQQEKTSLQGTVSSLRSDLEQRQAFEKDRDAALATVAETEKELRIMERKLNERDSKVEYLERSNAQTAVELERSKSESEARLNDMQAKLDTTEALVRSLKEAIEAKEGAEHESDTLLKAKNAEISLLEARLETVSTELEAERAELGSQIEELRQAGQETIALYEERLSTGDSSRYEMEDKIIFLEDQLRKATVPPSPGPTALHSASALEIDNETLRDQIQHLQRKVSMMEDTLEDVQAAAENEEAAMRERIRRFKEKEDSMRNELTEGRKAVDQVAKAEAFAKGRIEEVEEALRESTLALENARAEIEILRTDAAAADIGTNDVSPKVVEVSRQAAMERARLMDEIQDLKDKLEHSRSASQPLRDVGNTEDTRWRTMFEHEQAEVQSLRMVLEERSVELDNLRKRLNRELAMNGLPEASKSPSKYELEEITGLKHIVQETQKETLALTQRNKLLEAENRLLISETDQLRQELKILEDNVEQGLLKQEAALDAADSSSDLSPDLQKKYEGELEQLRKRLADAEIKTARITHDLNKEISELETLVESKIYREDELEREIEHLKINRFGHLQEKFARSKKLSKGSTESIELDQRRPSSASTIMSADDDFRSSSCEDLCEICERPGHDIFTCDLLKEDAPASLIRARPSFGSEPYCLDCEGYGHTASDCPHSLDVF